MKAITGKDVYMTNEEVEEQQDSVCDRPCHPDAHCDECTEYWQRMIREGYWDNERHMWTDKGWNAITRSF